MTINTKLGTKELAAIAVMGALTTVATMFFQVPFPTTGGFFNLGDAVVVTTALIFGPLVGALAGGVGSGLADILLGYGVFAPYTLVIKGLEGFMVGYIARDIKEQPKIRVILAWLVGGFVIVAGYWVAEAYLMGLGTATATAEIIINLPQAIGSVIGIPIAYAVKSRLEI